MASYLRYLLLLAIKLATLVFYRFEARWMTEMPRPPLADLRVIALLHHTSLFEWLFAGSVPNYFLREIARRAVVPAAEVTVSRPVVGTFLKLLAPHLMAISRRPDHTWEAVLGRIDDDSLVVILPEGRMMRANGLDKHGKPMTVRGGISDILRVIPEGRFLVAYSGGLHHVQVPGQLLPRPFRTLKISFEVLDIADYRRELGGVEDGEAFKEAVKADLQRRRDLHCPAAVAGVETEPGRLRAAGREPRAGNPDPVRQQTRFS